MTTHPNCARLLGLVLALGMPMAWGQVSSNQSLSGKYFFRHVMLTTDSSGNLTDSRSASGTITFNGNGGFTFTAQQIVGTNAAAPLTGNNGSYTVKAGGFVTLTNPQKSGVLVNARLGPQGLIGASTESGTTLYDLLLAIPAPTQTMSAGSLTGTYYVSTLEFPNASLGLARDSFFPMGANGSGSFGSPSVTGDAINLNSTTTSQNVSGVTYAVMGDGSGTVTFPNADVTSAIVAGAKSIYVSQDGSYFIGGSMANGSHGFIVGVKANPTGATNGSWSGRFWGAGLQFSNGRLTAYTGSVNATGQGSAIWYRRIRQPEGNLDFTPLHPYNLNADGSGTALSDEIAVAAKGAPFVGSGAAAGNSANYEIYFGIQMPPQSGTGVFLNPQGIFNAASFAPAGNPVSPGEFVTIYGSGFATQSAAAKLPFPSTLAGVQVLVNTQPAPLYRVDATLNRIDMIVPYEVTGSTATFVIVGSNGTKSNSVDVPLTNTAPGIFSINSNGIGPGAVLHGDFSVVSTTSPAHPGEEVQVFLTGLGAVTPAVKDGMPAPTSAPLAVTNGPVGAYVGGAAAAVVFQGLAPGFAGLYQVNVQIPGNVELPTNSDAVPLAIQTGTAFSDLVDIAVAP